MAANNNSNSDSNRGKPLGGNKLSMATQIDHEEPSPDKLKLRTISMLGSNDGGKSAQEQLTDKQDKSPSQLAQATGKASTSHSRLRPSANADPVSLFPDIGSIQQPDRSSMATQNSAQRQTNLVVTQPGQQVAATACMSVIKSSDQQSMEQQLVSPGSTNGSGRKLQNFNVKQRLSHSQVSSQIQGSNNRTRQKQVTTGHMETIINKQNSQHQQYISRQTQNAQILTQSIGDASNASYVFDGGSAVPTRGAVGDQNYSSHFQRHVNAPLNINPAIESASFGINQQSIDNRSFSNGSSPSSMFQRRNLFYKNVKNYSNLYDKQVRGQPHHTLQPSSSYAISRSMASKNIEMQDTLRLGGAQKLIRNPKYDQFLPQIHNQGGTNSNFGFTNQSLMRPSELSGPVSHMTHMKRIKRSVMEDGSHQPQIELRKDLISPHVVVDKPGTHHGYQSTHYNAGMANTEPFQKQNMTSTSFNQQADVSTDLWKAHTANTPFMPELSVSSNYRLEAPINMVKPLLRRNCLHNRANIVVQWKSFEIWVVRLEYAGGADQTSNKLLQRKILNPIYVPLNELTHLLTLSLSQIETRVVKSLKMGPTGKQFLYVPIDTATGSGDPDEADFSPTRQSVASPNRPAPGGTSPTSKQSDGSPTRTNSFKPKVSELTDQSLGRTHSSKTDELVVLDDKLPEEIITSLYMQQAGYDFQIIIRPPVVEYSIPSKNFVFMKTLTREENSHFLQSGFAEWHHQVIRTLSQYNKFNEMLAIVEKGTDYKIHLARQEALRYQKPKDATPILVGRKGAQLDQSRNVAQPQSNSVRRDKTYSPSAMQVYVLEESSGQLCDYASLTEFKQKRFLDPRSGRLRGCFNQNNTLGHIDVRLFAIVIKGLDTDYEYRHQFQSTYWSKIVGFMQKKAMKQPYNPKQLVGKVCKLFIRSLHRARARGENELTMHISQVLKSKKKAVNAQGKALTCYPLMSRDEKINDKVNELAETMIHEPSMTTQKLSDLRNNARLHEKDIEASDKQQISQQQSKDSIEQQRKRFVQDSKQAIRSFLSGQKRSRMLQVPQDLLTGTQPTTKPTSTNDQDAKAPQARFLIEIEFPQCSISYQGQNHTKALTEEDLVVLCSTQFCRWKNYLMTKHFRLELNIGQEKPLPRILEELRGEDDLISEADPRDKFPITEAEKPELEQTRAQVTNWFAL